MTVNINGTGVKTVVSSTLANGTAIDPNAVYKGVTIKYLLDGGDRFRLVIGSTYNVTNNVTIGDFRSTMRPYLSAIGTVRAGVFKTPGNPTLIINNI